jgi:hypothetical protein
VFVGNREGGLIETIIESEACDRGRESKQSSQVKKFVIEPQQQIEITEGRRGQYSSQGKKERGEQLKMQKPNIFER